MSGLGAKLLDLEYEHRITIAIKPIASGYRLPVSRQGTLMTRKRRHK